MVNKSYKGVSLALTIANLNQYDCLGMNMRIGIDIGENAIIQSWDIYLS